MLLKKPGFFDKNIKGSDIFCIFLIFSEITGIDELFLFWMWFLDFASENFSRTISSGYPAAD